MEEAVSLENIGAVTPLCEKEKQDEELQSFKKMLQRKKKKKMKKSNNDSNQANQTKYPTKTQDQKKTDAMIEDNDDNEHIAKNIGYSNLETNINTIHKDKKDDKDKTDLKINEIYYNNDNDHEDYPYTFLLDRLYRQLHEKNEKLFENEKNHQLPAPQVDLIGSKKTRWRNFKQTCELLKRKVDDVKLFFLAEMNTPGNLDGNVNLILKGRWRPRQFENILKKYIREYVECRGCHSPETILTRDNASRLYFLECKVCGCQRSVAPIKNGFHAVSKDDRRLAKKNAN